MNTLNLFLVSMMLLVTNCIFSQTVTPSTYFESLPAIKLDKSQARSYHMITDYYDFDLAGNFLMKKRIAGDLRCKNDSVQWKNVYFSNSKNLDDAFPEGEKVNHMENFKYHQRSDIIPADFFIKNLPEADPLTMNLIWDVLAFEVFAYDHWDSLKLNTEYRAVNGNNELEIAYGTFENKDIRITWLGTTKINNEICAILKYSVMNNLLNLKYENMKIKGRSHYWGEVYVSLSDKQIEYVNLTEDVLMEIKEEGKSKSDVQYTVRYITMSKLD